MYLFLLQIFEIMLLDVYIFRIIMYSCWMTLLSLCMSFYSFVIWNYLALKSTLSNIHICFYPLNFKISMPLLNFSGFPGSSDSKETTCLVKIWVQSLGWEDPLEEDMEIHILAWRIPWAEEPGGLQSMESQQVRHNLATKPPPGVPSHSLLGRNSPTQAAFWC